MAIINTVGRFDKAAVVRGVYYDQAQLFAMSFIFLNTLILFKNALSI